MSHAIVLALSVLVLLMMLVREGDAQSCSGFGNVINGACSCASGYGPSASTFPASDCGVSDLASAGSGGVCSTNSTPAVLTVDPLNTAGSPAFNQPASSFINDVITLEIDSAVTEGRENFTIDFYGATSGSVCGFPGVNWVQSPNSACEDTFTGSFQWSDLRSSCGFQLLPQNSPTDNLVYVNNLNVQYDEAISTSISRHVQNSLQMEVNFQTTITVTSTPLTVNGTYVGVIGFQAFLIEQSYNATTGVGTLVYETSSNWPYLVDVPNITCPAAVVGTPASATACTITDITDYNANCQQGSITATSNPACVQLFQVTVTPIAGACSLTGSYSLSTMATCESVISPLNSANCPGMGSLSFTSAITSSNFCPSLTLSAVLQGTLDAYTDITHTRKQTVAYRNGDTAFFMASISSPQATVLNAWFTDIAIINSGSSNGDLCIHSLDYNACVPTAYASNNSFAVDGKSTTENNNGKPGFQFNINVVGAGQPYGPTAPTPAMFSIAANGHTSFKVQATIMVSYQGQRRRLIRNTWQIERQSQTTTSQRAVTTTAAAGVAAGPSSTTSNGSGGGKNNGSSSSSSSAGSSSTLVIFGVIVGAIVGVALILFVVSRKRQQQQQQQQQQEVMYKPSVASSTVSNV